MNPKEFDWKEDQQVTVKNPTNEAFRFQAFNKNYNVEGGQTVKLPGYHAMLFVYHLAQKMAQNDGVFQSFIDEEFRQKYYRKIIVGAGDYMEVVESGEPEEDEPVDEDDQEDVPVSASVHNQGRRGKNRR